MMLISFEATNDRWASLTRSFKISQTFFPLIISSLIMFPSAPPIKNNEKTGNHSHSSRLNALCIISVRCRPGGCSESLWSSCSTASTASGYHFVIRVITGGWLLWRFVLSRRDIILQRPRCSKRQLQAADLVPQGRAVCLVGHGSCLVGKMPYE